jgi:hypothetical protein
VEAAAVLVDSVLEHRCLLPLELSTRSVSVLVVLVGLLHQHQAFQVVIHLLQVLLLQKILLALEPILLKRMEVVEEEMKQKMVLLVVLVVVVVGLLLLKPAAQVILQAPLLHRAILVETTLRQVISLLAVGVGQAQQVKHLQPIQEETAVMGQHLAFLAHR